MNVYLMRHGQASTGPSGESELTEQGRGGVEAIAGWCADQGIELDAVLHSSKMRARQTAEIVHSRVGALRLDEHPGLKPDDDPFAVAAMLESATTPVLIVSHLPILDCVAGLLVENDPNRLVVGFAPAQIACFERAVEGWRLVWTRRA